MGLAKAFSHSGSLPALRPQGNRAPGPRPLSAPRHHRPSTAPSKLEQPFGQATSSSSTSLPDGFPSVSQTADHEDKRASKSPHRAQLLKTWELPPKAVKEPQSDPLRMLVCSWPGCFSRNTVLMVAAGTEVLQPLGSLRVLCNLKAWRQELQGRRAYLVAYDSEKLQKVSKGMGLAPLAASDKWASKSCLCSGRVPIQNSFGEVVLQLQQPAPGSSRDVVAMLRVVLIANPKDFTDWRPIGDAVVVRLSGLSGKTSPLIDAHCQFSPAVEETSIQATAVMEETSAQVSPVCTAQHCQTEVTLVDVQCQAVPQVVHVCNQTDACGVDAMCQTEVQAVSIECQTDTTNMDSQCQTERTWPDVIEELLMFDRWWQHLPNDLSDESRVDLIKTLRLTARELGFNLDEASCLQEEMFIAQRSGKIEKRLRQEEKDRQIQQQLKEEEKQRMLELEQDAEQMKQTLNLHKQLLEEQKLEEERRRKELADEAQIKLKQREDELAAERRKLEESLTREQSLQANEDAIRGKSEKMEAYVKRIHDEEEERAKLEDEERRRIERLMCTRMKVRVVIVSASSLRKADIGIGAKSDPYCVCGVTGRPELTFKTDIVKKCLDPTWEQEHTFDGIARSDCIRFEVLDYDLGKKHDHLGWVVLDAAHFCPDGFEGDLELKESGKSQKEELKRGKATLRVKVEVVKVPTPTFGVRAFVKVIGAKGLRSADAVGKSDPYCVGIIPGKPLSKFRTKVVKNTLSPTWNEEVELIDYVGGDTLDFKVFDHDLVGKSDLLGVAKLASTMFHPNGFIGELALQSDKHTKGLGTLSVSIEIVDYASKPSTSQRH